MYTYGNEFKTLEGQMYIGDYHIIRGKTYTGKIHSFKSSKQLKPIQKQNQYYQYSKKYKQLIQNSFFDIKDFQLQDVTFKDEQQVLTVHIIKDMTTNLIYTVSKETYEKYRNNSLLKKVKIKLKNFTDFSSITYNKKQIASLVDPDIKKYLQKII